MVAKYNGDKNLLKKNHIEHKDYSCNKNNIHCFIHSTYHTMCVLTSIGTMPIFLMLIPTKTFDFNSCNLKLTLLVIVGWSEKKFEKSVVLKSCQIG